MVKWVLYALSPTNVMAITGEAGSAAKDLSIKQTRLVMCPLLIRILNH
jgi:hypothetical protein